MCSLAAFDLRELTKPRDLFSPGRFWVPVLALAAFVLTGCCSAHKRPANPPRTFDIARDTFAFRNELLWVYHYDAYGNWLMETREPKPDYALHCVVLARSAVQFFRYAEFQADRPRTNAETYRRLVRQVVGTSLRQPPECARKVVIPGYPDLRSFSSDYEAMLKAECGSFWISYFQRGNWRMVFPFSRRHQKKVADSLVQTLSTRGPVVVHISCFPSLAINHSAVVFGVTRVPGGLEFHVYDPNRVDGPETLRFDEASRNFILPANRYFPGGPVDVYEVYHRWNY